jgi:hypothetical protein
MEGFGLLGGGEAPGATNAAFPMTSCHGLSVRGSEIVIISSSSAGLQATQGQVSVFEIRGAYQVRETELPCS